MFRPCVGLKLAFTDQDFPDRVDISHGGENSLLDFTSSRGDPNKLDEDARNQETEAVKSDGRFGTFEPLGPGSRRRPKPDRAISAGDRACETFGAGLHHMTNGNFFC